MDQNQQVDYGGLKSNVQFHLAKGAHGLVACGSTGEFVSLTPEERRRVTEVVINEVNGRIPVVVGTAAETTQETMRSSREAQALGASGLMIINPYYMKPLEDEVFAHFQAVAAAVEIPIIVYNNPGTSGTDLSEDLLVRLAREIPRVQYIKESSGNIRKLRDILLRAEGHAQGFCGWDDMALESFLVGAIGWISVVGNFMPHLAARLFELAVDQKDLDSAWALYRRMLPLCQLVETCGKLVQTTKRAMDFMGQAGGPARSPRSPLTPAEEQRLRTLLQAADLI